MSLLEHRVVGAAARAEAEAPARSRSEAGQQHAAHQQHAVEPHAQPWLGAGLGLGLGLGVGLGVGVGVGVGSGSPASRRAWCTRMGRHVRARSGALSGGATLHSVRPPSVTCSRSALVRRSTHRPKDAPPSAHACSARYAEIWGDRAR